MGKRAHSGLVKISELVHKTGVQRETIRYYISNGLLPKPYKTSKNMAYYDESYVRRIKQIKELQSKYYLPLRIIKEIVAQAHAELKEEELEILRATVGGIMELQEIRRTYNPLTLEEMSRRTGLPKNEILEMEKCEMISFTRNEKGVKLYHDRDIKVVEAFSGIRQGGLTSELGFKVDQFRMQSDVLSALAKEEVKDFIRKLGVQFTLNYKIDVLARMSENAIEKVNGFMSALRRKYIFDFITALLEGRERFPGSADVRGKGNGKEVLMRHKTMEVIGNEKRKGKGKKNRRRGNT